MVITYQAPQQSPILQDKHAYCPVFSVLYSFSANTSSDLWGLCSLLCFLFFIYIALAESFLHLNTSMIILFFKTNINGKNDCLYTGIFVVDVQSLSRAQIFVTPWTIACQSPLSSSISHSLLKFMSIKSVRLSNHLIFCCPLLLFPSIFPSKRIFQSESAVCIRWPKYWSFSFSFSISCSNKYSGLTSWRID